MISTVALQVTGLLPLLVSGGESPCSCGEKMVTP